MKLGISKIPVSNVSFGQLNGVYVGGSFSLCLLSIYDRNQKGSFSLNNVPIHNWIKDEGIIQYIMRLSTSRCRML